MVRPSLLVVGPFTQKNKRTLRVQKLIKSLPLLQRALPPLHLFLVGEGATDCFQDCLNSAIILEDSEKEIESYVFYANALVFFKGTSPLQDRARIYSLKIGCPILTFPHLFFLSWQKNIFVSQALKQMTSRSNLLKNRIHAASY